MTAAVLPLRFQIGARTLVAVPRRVVRVSVSLADVLDDRVPALPPLAGDGYFITSLPADRFAALAAPGLVARVRQRYMRYHIDLSLGVEGWMATLSANTRAGIKRKAKKLAAAGAVTIDRYASPDEIAAFHPVARAVSATTYQERLLDAGLPEDAASLVRLAAADRVRAWLLRLDGAPIAYLCCTADGGTICYDYVGHDPAHGALSPGAVLQSAALHDLLTERRFARFDFTEGEGQHKRTLSTGGTACMDVLLLRATVANRVVLAALGAFDAGVAAVKRAATHPTLATLAKKVRR